MENDLEQQITIENIQETLPKLNSLSPVNLLQGSVSAGFLLSPADYEYFNEVEQAYIRLMLSISQVLDTHESYLVGHSARIALLATEVARAINLDEKDIEHINLAGYLHDIGEIIIPSDLLRKSGELTEEEIKLIQQHPCKGGQIIRSVKSLVPVAEIVETHHERFDGSGYPNQLLGEEIPIGARILAVVDTYDAITNFRLHKTSHDHSIAINVLKESSGNDYDPAIIDAFIGLF